MKTIARKLVTSRKEHQCDKCGKLFPIGSSLYRVTRIDEEANMIRADYICTACSEVATKSDLSSRIYLREKEKLLKKGRRDQLKRGQIYLHFKGDKYVIEGIALDTATEKDVVVYRKLNNPDTLFTKPVNEFLSKVDKGKYPDVSQIYRFEAVDN